jgi:RNase P subunit RPR2
MCDTPYLDRDERYWLVGCEECGEVRRFLVESRAWEEIERRKKMR